MDFVITQRDEKRDKREQVGFELTPGQPHSTLVSTFLFGGWYPLILVSLSPSHRESESHCEVMGLTCHRSPSGSQLERLQ